MLDRNIADDRSWYDSIVLICALGLIAAPWIFGYAADHNAAISSCVAGLAIAACGISGLFEYKRLFREVDVALGLLTAAAPWLLRFTGDHKALTVHLIAGGLVGIISAGELLLQSGNPPHVST